MCQVVGSVPGQVQKGVRGLLVAADALQTQAVGVQSPRAHAGFDDEGQGHPDPRGDQRGHQKVGDRDAAQLPQGARVQAGGARDEAAHHQGQDDHLEHPEEHLSGEGEVGHLRFGQIHVPDHHAEPDAHEHAGHGHDHQQVLPQKLRQLLPEAPLRALLRDPLGAGRAGHGVPVDLALLLHPGSVSVLEAAWVGCARALSCGKAGPV